MEVCSGQEKVVVGSRNGRAIQSQTCTAGRHEATLHVVLWFPWYDTVGTWQCSASPPRITDPLDQLFLDITRKSSTFFVLLVQCYNATTSTDVD